MMALLFILGEALSVALAPSARQTPAQAVREAGPARSDGAQGTGQASGLKSERRRRRGTRRRRTRDRQAAGIASACDTARRRRGGAAPEATARARSESGAGSMVRTTVEYWQHVGTGEVFAVRVDADGRIVSARGPLTAAAIGAALFGDPARGAAWRDLPIPADEETDAASLDHVRGLNLDREADYITLPPWRGTRPATAPHDDGDGA